MTVVLDLPRTRTAERQKPGDGKIVGRFGHGRIAENRPISLPFWCLTTSDQRIATEVLRVLGNSEESTDVQGGESEVVTKSTSLSVVVDGPGAIVTQMKLWGPGGLVHHCDGAVLLQPAAKRGDPCGCPESISDRKAYAKAGLGPQPNIVVTFELTGIDLGRFEFQSASWKLFETVHEVRSMLALVNGPTTCEMTLELAEFTTTSRRRVSYYKPVLRVVTE